MKLAYNGLCASVHVPALKRDVERGEAVEISDPRLYRQLRRQGWSRVKDAQDNNTKDGDDK